MVQMFLDTISSPPTQSSEEPIFLSDKTFTTNHTLITIRSSNSTHSPGVTATKTAAAPTRPVPMPPTEPQATSDNPRPAPPLPNVRPEPPNAPPPPKKPHQKSIFDGFHFLNVGYVTQKNNRRLYGE
jgi:hypothetical protein